MKNKNNVKIKYIKTDINTTIIVFDTYYHGEIRAYYSYETLIGIELVSKNENLYSSLYYINSDLYSNTTAKHYKKFFGKTHKELIKKHSALCEKDLNRTLNNHLSS